MEKGREGKKMDITKEEVLRLVREDFNSLRRDMDSMRSEFKDSLSSLRSDMDSMRSEFKDSLSSLSSGMNILPTRIQPNYEYRSPTDTGLGLGKAIGATPSRFNPSYSR